MLVRRGLCTFVEKAKNVQHALGSGVADDAEIGAKTQHLEGGTATGDLGEIQTSTAGGGMVLVNGEDTLADMPAGQLMTDDVHIPVAMQVDHSDILPAFDDDRPGILMITVDNTICASWNRNLDREPDNKEQASPHNATIVRKDVIIENDIYWFDWNYSLLFHPTI